MHSAPHETYLATEVQTATPPKLRWMLIDGAVRRGEAARQLWQSGNDLAAADALVKCHALVGELLGSARAADSQLARDVVRLYTYLFRTLTEAVRDRDPDKLGHVLTILHAERETWREVSEKLSAEQDGQKAPELESSAFVPVAGSLTDGQTDPTRLSLDA